MAIVLSAIIIQYLNMEPKSVSFATDVKEPNTRASDIRKVRDLSVNRNPTEWVVYSMIMKEDVKIICPAGRTDEECRKIVKREVKKKEKAYINKRNIDAFRQKLKEMSPQQRLDYLDSQTNIHCLYRKYILKEVISAEQKEFEIKQLAEQNKFNRIQAVNQEFEQLRQQNNAMFAGGYTPHAIMSHKIQAEHIDKMEREKLAKLNIH